MTGRPMARGLLAAAHSEFNAEILPELGPDRRYLGAMLRRALDVLQREAAAAETPEAVLGRAGFGTAAELASALRRRRTTQGPALRQALRAYVERKLALSNPRFLETTRSAKSPETPSP